MAIKFQFRRGTTAEWSSANPVLASGEIGLDTTLKIIRVGNGVTAWNSLGAFSPPVDSPVFTTVVTTPKLSLVNGQIDFPATQVPSADANTLDDYEEGVWTPAVTFGGGSTGITYSTRGGYYTKVGNIVHLTGFFLLTNKGSSTGAAKIEGLPFTVVNNVGGYATLAPLLENISFANQFGAYAGINGIVIPLMEMTEAGVQTALDNANFANNSNGMISLSYRVA